MLVLDNSSKEKNMFPFAQTQTMNSINGVLIIGVGDDGKPCLQYVGTKETQAALTGTGSAAIAIPVQQLKATSVQKFTELPADTTPATPPKKRGRKSNAEKAALAAAATQTTPTAVTPTTQTTTPAATTPKKRGRKSNAEKAAAAAAAAAAENKHSFKVWLPLDQCYGVAKYTGKKGISTTVAIWDVVQSRADGTLYRLAFITKEARDDGKGGSIQFAYHKDGKFAVVSNCERLTDVRMFE